MEERRVFELPVGDIEFETISEGSQLVFVEFFLLMGDVLGLDTGPKGPSFDRMGEDDGGSALMLHRCMEGRVHFSHIVTTPSQPANIVIGKMFDQFQQAWVFAKEVRANEVSRLDGVFLELAIDDLVHSLHEDLIRVSFEKSIPFPTPDHFDDVPSGAAEDSFEFLDDLAIAAHGSIEALKVAVDDEDQVVEFVSAREGQGTQRFRLVHFPVPEECKYAISRCFCHSPRFEVAIEARLVDGEKRAQTHRYGWIFPELRHQSWVRIGRQAVSEPLFTTKSVEVAFGETTFEIGASVDAGSGMSLKQDLVVTFGEFPASEEVIEPRFVQAGGGGIGGEMPADPMKTPVGAHDHDGRVPSDQTSNSFLDLFIAWIGRFFGWVDGIDVGGLHEHG